MTSVPKNNNQIIERVCKFYLKNSCSRDNCKFLHSKQNNKQIDANNKQYKKKNTEHNRVYREKLKAKKLLILLAGLF